MREQSSVNMSEASVIAKTLHMERTSPKAAPKSASLSSEEVSRMLLRAAVGFIAGMAGMDGFAPLALPVAVSAWSRRESGFATLAGALVSALLCSRFASFASLAVFAGAELLMSLCGLAQNGRRAFLRRVFVMGAALAAVFPFVYEKLPLIYIASLVLSPFLLLLATAAEAALYTYAANRRQGKRSVALISAAAFALLLAFSFAPPIASGIAATALVYSLTALLRERAGAYARLERLRFRITETADVARRLSKHASYKASECEREEKSAAERVSTGGETLLGSGLSGFADALESVYRASRQGAGELELEAATANVAKQGSDMTGDCAEVKRLPSGTVLILGDGMGTGGDAHRESAEAAAIIGDLLKIGFSFDEAQRFLNRLMLLSGDETYTTLDVALFDRARGDVDFMKFGAPPSFILREGRVTRLEAESLPAGILEEAEAAHISARLREGDALVMLTDGLYDALGMGLISSIVDGVGSAESAESAARGLIERGIRSGYGDDMSAIVAFVSKRKATKAKTA